MRNVTIVGMGPGGCSLMTAAAQDALAQADLVVGSSRLIDAACPSSASRVIAVRARDIVENLARAGWSRACVLMSGDTGFFSGACGLPEALRSDERLSDCTIEVFPGVSSASMLAARLCRPWSGWRFVSAHGVELDIVGEARRGGDVFALTSGSASPAALCSRLVDAGFGQTPVTVAERLAYPDERIRRFKAEEVVAHTFDPLNVLLFEFGVPGADEAASCSNGSSRWPWRTMGIPDELFMRGHVPMTKQEVRAVALAKLKLAGDDVVFDVGAGTGSVTVEAALQAARGEVFAIECAPEAAELVRQNVRSFGVDNVCVVEGTAPAALCGLPTPDAVFIGGCKGALTEIVDELRCRGSRIRVCATAVSLETLGRITALFTQEMFTDFEVCQVQVARSERAGAHHLMRAQNPVFVASATLEPSICDTRGGGAR